MCSLSSEGDTCGAAHRASSPSSPRPQQMEAMVVQSITAPVEQEKQAASRLELWPSNSIALRGAACSMDAPDMCDSVSKAGASGGCEVGESNVMSGDIEPLPPMLSKELPRDAKADACEAQQGCAETSCPPICPTDGPAARRQLSDQMLPTPAKDTAQEQERVENNENAPAKHQPWEARAGKCVKGLSLLKACDPLPASLRLPGVQPSPLAQIVPVHDRVFQRPPLALAQSLQADEPVLGIGARTARRHRSLRLLPAHQKQTGLC